METTIEIKINLKKLPLSQIDWVESISVNGVQTTDIDLLNYIGSLIYGYKTILHTKELGLFDEDPKPRITSKIVSEPIPIRSMVPTGYVYVMKDTIRNNYKIGYSTNPVYRESTLQAEVPSIELVAKHAGTVYDERELHSVFKAQRLRGEWFNLSNADLERITRYFDPTDV